MCCVAWHSWCFYLCKIENQTKSKIFSLLSNANDIVLALVGIGKNVKVCEYLLITFFKNCEENIPENIPYLLNMNVQNKMWKRCSSLDQNQRYSCHCSWIEDIWLLFNWFEKLEIIAKWILKIKNEKDPNQIRKLESQIWPLPGAKSFFFFFEYSKV